MFAALLAGVVALAPAAGGELRVRLVEGRGDVPVAGGEVHARFVVGEEARRSATGWRREEMGLADFEARVLAEGERAVADASGVLVLRPRAGWSEVELVARAPGRFGAEVVESGQEGRFGLYADFELRVRTLDAVGALAAGVPVCLRRRRELDDALIPVESGADGIAVIPHAGYLRSRVIEAGTATMVSVVLDVCLDRAVAVDIVGPRAEPIALELPPTGTVDVAFAGLEDSPAASGGRVRLARADGRGEPFLDWEPYTVRPAGCVSADLVAGRARFRHVGLGLKLEMSGRINVPSAPRWASCEGPKVPAETVEVPLAVDEGCASVGGRLVDPQGVPLAEALVRIDPAFTPQPRRIEDDDIQQGGGAMREVLRTDGEGRFALDVEWMRTWGSPLSQLEVRSPRADRTSVGTLVELEALVPGEERGLGDVVLQAEVLVARGRVLDSSGDPVVGAEVELGSRLDAFFEGFREEGEETLDAVVVATDEAGRFELSALPWFAVHELSVSARGFEKQWVEVVPPTEGETGVVLWRRAGSKVARNCRRAPTRPSSSCNSSPSRMAPLPRSIGSTRRTQSG